MRRYTTVGVDEALTNLATAINDLTAKVDTLTTVQATLRDDVTVLRADIDSHTRTLTTLSHALHDTAPGAGSSVGPNVGLAAGPSVVPPSWPGGGATDGTDGADDDGNDSGGGGIDTGAAGEEPAEPDEPVAAAWLTVTDPSVAVAWLNELAVWVPAVWQPHLPTPTPACWPWHPPVVAELLVLQQLWNEAVAAAPDPAPLANWHDRWRPGAHLRIARHTAGCERAEGRHKVFEAEYAYDTAYLDELAEWWATTGRTQTVTGAGHLTAGEVPLAPGLAPARRPR